MNILSAECVDDATGAYISMGNSCATILSWGMTCDMAFAGIPISEECPVSCDACPSGLDGCDLPDFSLSVADNGEILYNTSADLGGFQFRITGVTLDAGGESASGGAADAAGFTVSTLGVNDNDGDDDLIIGNSFETNTFPWNGRLKYLENIGNQEQPVYEIINEEFLGNLIGKDLTPTFIDIDNDGDLDFFSGETYGSILFAENIGGENNLEFGNITSFEGLDLGYSSVPDFVDIDNDNDFDMFIGNSDGSIYFYENIGTPDVYNFILITEQFFEINVGNKSAPEFHDLDNDGDFDLIIGNEPLPHYELKGFFFTWE